VIWIIQHTHCLGFSIFIIKFQFGQDRGPAKADVASSLNIVVIHLFIFILFYPERVHLLNVSVTFQAYLEFFTCKEVVDALLEVLKEYPQVNYHVVNCEVSWISTSPCSMCIDLRNG